MRTLPLICTLALLASGCFPTKDDSYAVPALHKQASFDLDCPEAQLQIMETSKDQYGVVGCDKRTTYAVDGCDAVSRECTFRRTEPIEPKPG
jgi:nanoRNase/pAp phosphatase (c-di-AMP/oligoRNAs hydrolase)